MIGQVKYETILNGYVTKSTGRKPVWKKSATSVIKTTIRLTGKPNFF